MAAKASVLKWFMTIYHWLADCRATQASQRAFSSLLCDRGFFHCEKRLIEKIESERKKRASVSEGVSEGGMWQWSLSRMSICPWDQGKHLPLLSTSLLSGNASFAFFVWQKNLICICTCFLIAMRLFYPKIWHQHFQHFRKGRSEGLQSSSGDDWWPFCIARLHYRVRHSMKALYNVWKQHRACCMQWSDLPSLTRPDNILQGVL